MGETAITGAQMMARAANGTHALAGTHVTDSGPGTDMSEHVATSAGTCRISLHTSFDTIAPIWNSFQNEAVMTPYQRLAFLRAWHATLGVRDGTVLRIIEGRSPSGELAFILPLGLCTCLGLRTLGWLGGKHANYAMGLYAPDSIATYTPDDWSMMLRAATRLAGADIAVLLNQPEQFEGVANPLQATRTHASASPCHATRLEHDTDAMMARLRNKASRKKIRRNTRRLEETSGPVVLKQAQTAAGIIEAIAALRTHKAQLDDTRADKHIFSDDRVTGFLTQAAIDHGEGPALEIFVLKAGDAIVATFGCVTSDTRAAGTFISVDIEDHAQSAPSEVLIAQLLAHFAARGIKTFDLGIGDGEYKRRWCHDSEPLFDTVLPVSRLARTYGAPMINAMMRLKALVKSSPRLFALAQRLTPHTVASKS